MRYFVLAVLTVVSFSAFAGYQEGYESFKQNRFADAVKEFQPLAEKGDVKSQYYLGTVYANDGGKDVPGDMEKAAYWFAKAAKQGDGDSKSKLAIAQLIIGSKYYSGKGKTPDYAKAAEWFLPSAESGNAESQFMIGLMYEEGQYYQQDYGKSVYWYRKAADQGHENASVNLGVSYQKGHGVKQDLSQAYSWFKKAAENGYGDGFFALGNMYYEGDGVQQDYVIAYMFWKLAAAHDSGSDPSKSIVIVSTELNEQQIAEGQALADQWKEGKPFSTKSKTWKKPPPVKITAVKLNLCAPPRGNSISYSDRCTNGDCVRTFANGCQKRISAAHCYDALQDQWVWKPDGC